MPSRLHLCSNCLRSVPRRRPFPFYLYKSLATASAITPAPPYLPQHHAPSSRQYPPTQPPSHRPPELRKSQLHRQYTSLLRSTPLMLLFQHNNLKSTEWMAVRRELTIALKKTDATIAAAATLQPTPSPPPPPGLTDGIKIQIIQTRIFTAALLIAEHYHPSQASLYPHNSLSRTAHDLVTGKKRTNPLTPLLSGPLAILTFPLVSPPHLKAALQVLAPRAPAFAAPARRTNPGYWNPVTQAGLQKLLMLGARVEGRVFDGEGTRWVGGLGDGGVAGLRAELVHVLAGIGAQVAATLEAPGRSLYFALEGRKGALEDEVKGEPEANSEGKAKGDVVEG